MRQNIAIPSSVRKPAGDLLLHFDHAQIALGLVVVEGNRKIVQEPQHDPLSLREAIQQIAGRALFDVARLLRFVCSDVRTVLWRGIGTVAFCENGLVPTKEACQYQGIEFVLAFCALARSTAAFISRSRSFMWRGPLLLAVLPPQR